MIATVVNELAAARRFTDLSVDFTAEVLNRDATRIGESFSVDIELFISTTTLPMSGKLRRLKVAVQQTISSNPAGLRLENITRQGSMLPLNLPLCSPRHVKPQAGGNGLPAHPSPRAKADQHTFTLAVQLFL